jgi:hypothetical protein
MLAGIPEGEEKEMVKGLLAYFSDTMSIQDLLSD